jgi:predicted phage terminase large subunit-like protein
VASLTKSDERRLLLAELKVELQYSGPDDARWEAATLALALVLGYNLEDNHRETIAHYARNRRRRRSLLLGFRGMGKSTVGTVTCAIKYALEDPNIRILFTSATDGAAKEFLKEARIHLQTNEDLNEMFGQFFDPSGGKGVTGKFRDGYATIAQRTMLWLREPTFLSIGIGGQTASRHFDVVFADDLVVEKNSRTNTQRENIRSWHDSTLIGALMSHSRVHYLGTRYYPNDLYDDLQHGRAGEGDGVLADCTAVLPLVKNYDAEYDLWETTSPERHPREVCVQLRKEMGAYHFQAQMQQDTRSGEGIIFSYADFMWYNGPEDRPADEDLHIFQFYDLAALKTDLGAFFAGVTLGVYYADNGEVRIYVLDLLRERAGMKRQRDLIYRHTAQWKPIIAGVEAVAMQAGFAQEMQESSMLPVVPVPLTGKMEGDKVARARRVAPKVEGHQVYFPVEDSPAGRRVEPLVRELGQFPDGDFKDCVDAFVGAMTLAMYGGPPAASPTLPDGDDDDDLLANYDLD